MRRKGAEGAFPNRRHGEPKPMSRITSTLTMQLVDDVSRPARSVAQALRDTERTARMAAKAMASTGGTERFAKSLSKLDLSKADIRAVAKEWAAYAKSAGLASKATEWTTTQAAADRDLR